MRYVALLRGINVTGHKKVSMADLRTIFDKLGFIGIKTFLASGNAVFEADETDEGALVEAIQTGIVETFGFESATQVRTGDAFAEMVAGDPFKDMVLTKELRFYASFSPRPITSVDPPDGCAFRFVGAGERELFSVMEVGMGSSVDLMEFLDATYGKDVTTRNWNTVMQVASYLGESAQ